jgi:metal-sulfur cluster biosynthetic enzyme
MPTKEEVIAVIKQCYDPEIPVNVYDLGLIYDIQIDDANDAVQVTMSLTTQGCPSAQQIPSQIEEMICSNLNVKNVKATVVWDPPWTPERITPEGKKRLGI